VGGGSSDDLYVFITCRSIAKMCITRRNRQQVTKKKEK
jgi:hypothetical protein